MIVFQCIDCSPLACPPALQRDQNYKGDMFFAVIYKKKVVPNRELFSEFPRVRPFFAQFL